MADTLLGRARKWTGSTLKAEGHSSGLRCVAGATHLPLPEDVPEQRQVLRGEVPERPDAPAVADGDQVQVIQLQSRSTAGSAGDRAGEAPILESPSEASSAHPQACSASHSPP